MHLLSICVSGSEVHSSYEWTDTDSHQPSTGIEAVMSCRAYSHEVKGVTIITSGRLVRVLLLHLLPAFLDSK